MLHPGGDEQGITRPELCDDVAIEKPAGALQDDIYLILVMGLLLVDIDWRIETQLEGPPSQCHRVRIVRVHSGPIGVFGRGVVEGSHRVDDRPLTRART